MAEVEAIDEVPFHRVLGLAAHRQTLVAGCLHRSVVIDFPSYFSVF